MLVVSTELCRKTCIGCSQLLQNSTKKHAFDVEENVISAQQFAVSINIATPVLPDLTFSPKSPSTLIQNREIMHYGPFWSRLAHRILT